MSGSYIYDVVWCGLEMIESKQKQLVTDYSSSRLLINVMNCNLSARLHFAYVFRKIFGLGFQIARRTGVRSWSLAQSGVRPSQRGVGGCKLTSY